MEDVEGLVQMSNEKRDPGCLGYMDVSKNSGTPKWMVYNGKPY